MTREHGPSKRAVKDSARDAGREARAVLTSVGVTVGAVVIWAGAWLVAWGVCSASTPVPAVYRQASEFGVSATLLAEGTKTFAKTCAVCHGPDAAGIPRLGKPLRNNEFIQSLTDEDLLHFIETGRLPTDPQNTTGVPMPARGGDPTIRKDSLEGVVALLRTMQDPDAEPADMSAWVIDLAATDAGGGDSGLGGVGHDEFIAACSACHGPDAHGLPGLGKPLDTSVFVESKTDEELMNFIKTGRPIWDAENTTGLDMPPKGGNPALTDEQIRQIITYIRSLHK